jgi:sugar phosphate isomerase/epimerase
MNGNAMNHPLTLAVLLDGPPADFAAEVRLAASLGFAHVDVVALEERPTADLEALADGGVMVRCAAVGRGLPDFCAPDVADVGLRRDALEQMRRQVADAARLGATHAYVVSGADDSAAGLADYAAGRMVRLCVEPVPGRALPSAAAVLAWLAKTGHNNLALLLDVGHCPLSGEEAAAVARAAAPRLVYVHLDDNDGVSYLHWPLLTGRLTETHLTALEAALRETAFTGGISLELKTSAAERAPALRASKEIAERLFPQIRGVS